MQTDNIPILMYHSISHEVHPGFRRFTISPEVFGQQLRYLHEHHYTTLTVTDVARIIRAGGALPALPVVLTFDDGFADFYTTALPLLSQYGFTATLYLTTEFIGEQRWPTYAAHGLMLTWKQIQEIAATHIECAAHTQHHPALDTLPVKAALHEIIQSKCCIS